MNAKEEFLELVKDAKCNLLCADINLRNGDRVVLKKGHSEKDYIDFLSQLDFDYDANSDFFFGSVWFENALWACRLIDEFGQYWKIIKVPEIPNELLS